MIDVIIYNDIKRGDLVTLRRGRTLITDTVADVRPVRSTGLHPNTLEVNLDATGLWHRLNPSPLLSAWDILAREPAVEVTDFVPEPDTAALRAEVERAAVANENLIRAQQIEEEARLWEQRRADAAEARLARVTALLDAPGYDVSCAGRDFTTPGCFAHDLAARIRALVADDEQAAEDAEHRLSAANCREARNGEPISSGTVCGVCPVPGVGGAA